MIKVNGQEIQLRHFPDGTPLLKVGVSGEAKNVTWMYDGEHELPVLIYIVSHLRQYGCFPINLYMPYIPNARMDRIKADNEVFTLKYFADIINSLHFQNVYVLDPHSSVSAALIDRVQVFTPNKFISAALNDIMQSEIAMVYPDEGAMKRYSDMFRIPYAFGVKKRGWSTGAIEGLEIMGDGLNGKKSALICDDICSKGGTFLHTARALKSLGVENVFLYVTHCENTILEGELINSGLLAGIYTTNSIFRKNHPLITVFDVEELKYGN